MICLISLSKFSDVSPAFTCVRTIGNHWNTSLGVNIFNHFSFVVFIENIPFLKVLIPDLHKEHIHFQKYFFFIFASFCSWFRFFIKFFPIFQWIALIHFSFIYINFASINILPKDLIVSYCWKSYMNFFVSYFKSFPLLFLSYF